MSERAQMATTLYPDWTGPRTALPNWVVSYGLSKRPVIVQRVYASAFHWKQAEIDGLSNIAPMLVRFNRSPSEIRRQIGGEYWKRIHHDTLKANVDKLVLMMVLGWSLDEAMLFPSNIKKRANYYIKASKSAMLLASRLHARGGDFMQFYIMANDINRMGGTLDQTWGRKRTKAEHDALVMKRVMASTNNTPWAKAWFYDVGPYSFSLLKSESELVIEGATQRHCVGSYAKACREGREFVLRVEGKERATCSWAKGDNAMQIQGFANTDVSKECRLAAKEARLAFLESLKGTTK